MWTTDQYGNSVRVSDAIRLAGTADANGVTTYGDNRDWREELAAYNNERAINRLMRQRHGVNM